MASQVTSSTSSSLVASVVVIFLTCVAALPASKEDKPIGDSHQLQLPQQGDPADHQVSRRKVSLSHKYVGLGRRSSYDADADGLADEDSAVFSMYEPDRRSLSSFQLSDGDDVDLEEKRALPSNLRYTGLGKRRQSGVSNGMRYAGLGKRMAEMNDGPETALLGADDDEEDPKRTRLVGTGKQTIDRRRRFAVDDMLDDMENEDGSDVYVIKRQPTVSTMPGRQRIGAGMRYVGVGKRKQLPSLRSRVDAGMRYIGIGK